jgi:hypothetical protein
LSSFNEDVPNKAQHIYRSSLKSAGKPIEAVSGKLAIKSKLAYISLIISEGSFGETKVFGVSYEKTVVLREEKEPILGWLVVLEGEPKWQDYRIPLKDSQILIGSSQEANIQLKGQGIEKVHASLRVKEGKVYLTDLDTETGTRVNGEAITKVEIEDGSEIEIGNVRLKFRRL